MQSFLLQANVLTLHVVSLFTVSSLIKKSEKPLRLFLKHRTGKNVLHPAVQTPAIADSDITAPLQQFFGLQ